MYSFSNGCEIISMGQYCHRRLFDDCQDIVKALQQDAEPVAIPLGTVNSINWGRILAQIVYYS
jgi:threonine synthase